MKHKNHNANVKNIKKSNSQKPWVSVLIAILSLCIFLSMSGCTTETETTTEVSKPQVESISFSNSSDIEFRYVNYPDKEYFTVEISNQNSDTDYSELLDFVSENTKVATVKYNTDSSIYKSVIVTPVSDGETYIYIQTKDKKVKSEKIKVVVDLEQDETTEEETTTYEYTEATTKKKSSRTVYITPYGEKYHYSKSCAGKNAKDAELDDVKDSYGPCKKCVG